MDKKKKSLWHNFKGLLEYNSANVSGCIDIIVVEDENKELSSTPFHFRVGKFQLLKSSNTALNLYINGNKIEYSMKISPKGVGYWEYEGDPGDSDDAEEDLLYSDDDERTEPKKEEIKPSMAVQRKMSDVSKDDLAIMSKNEDTGVEAMDDGENQIELSLCAHLIHEKMEKHKVSEIFNQNKISFQMFDKNPYKILQNENLLIKIGKKIYDSHIGLPQIVSLLAFNEELTPLTISNMRESDQIVEAISKFETNTSKKPNRRLKKSLKPSKAILNSLLLSEGLNHLEYRFTGNLDTEIVFTSRIFFYKYYPQRRIVISDIDGTITRSDVLGHIMPFLYQDWSHIDICEFFTNLASRGYILIYLTARNIGQFSKTLAYLKSVKQKGFKLPEGPLITSPDSLFESLKREVIIKNPEVFKIHVLRDIKHVFGDKNHNSIFAGFGNKDTDAIAYRVISVPKRRIFIINPNGDIFQLKSHEIFSYKQLNERINEFFPPFEKEDEPPKEDMYMKKMSMLDNSLTPLLPHSKKSFT